MNQNNTPLSWILWHPHQGLWNPALVGLVRSIIPLSPISKLFTLFIIHIDTLILLLRALTRRVSLLGFTSIVSKARVPDTISILYFDLGTHKEAQELVLIVDKILPRISDNVEAYGFEASRESFDEAKAKFHKNKHVHLFNKALCCELPVGGNIKLYKDSGNGIGDSLYRKGGNYEEVEALRLSDWFSESNIDLEKSICLLRMNIEGAEYDVLRDLVDNMLAQHIDGYFGMWDDVSKIDLQRGNDFRAFLSDNQINSFTFNGRDMRWPLRVKCIEYAIETAVQVGLRKIQR